MHDRPCERIYPDTNGSVVQLWITDLFARIVFAPEPDEWGAKYANLTFTLTDSGYPYGPSLSVDVIVTINVNPVNDPPCASQLESEYHDNLSRIPCFDQGCKRKTSPPIQTLKGLG